MIVQAPETLVSFLTQIASNQQLMADMRRTGVVTGEVEAEIAKELPSIIVKDVLVYMCGDNWVYNVYTNGVHSVQKVMIPVQQ